MNLTFDTQLFTPPTKFTPQHPSKSDASSHGLLSDHSVPNTELCENTSGFELLVELPGVTRENLTITINNGVLQLTAKRNDSLPGTALIRESQATDFVREFRLGSTIDVANITAILESGLLHLRIPKLPQAQLRHIPLVEPETN